MLPECTVQSSSICKDDGMYIEYMYKCMHYKDTSSSSPWGQKSTCDS